MEASGTGQRHDNGGKDTTDFSAENAERDAEHAEDYMTSELFFGGGSSWLWSG